MRQLFDGQWPGTVLFDLDGTLVDSAPDLAAAIDAMLETIGQQPAGIDRVREWVGNGAQVLVKRALAGGFDYEAGEPFSESDFKHALDLFFDTYGDLNGRLATVYDGVEPFLRALAAENVRLGVVTNKPTAFTGPLLEKMGLAHWFRISVCGDTLPVKKPDPEQLYYAVEELGGDMARTLMVGDSVNDIQAAQRAGVPVVAVRYGYNYGGNIDEAGADIVVDSLVELL
ncbi:phosphoglycolate phosphatase [Marinobacter nanhaiticus D15-8W]|uniref:Phosphoglycolate phosphatase n=1 Tax=Marinobacter nanhaiticus D15-8W TaxID=626887 RepID=N6WXE5_9GAMM|nr:phosphoglycolate phosphatase [Marinobacter nanhaiticus]ENO15712.1 phosphoglycolate phosphatase [Marinobacter nanhaiticus D15-8W]BES73431.1 phosphoglycolate phosphatase [Marinobacter nanhaiticus D15-8W]